MVFTCEPCNKTCARVLRHVVFDNFFFKDGVVTFNCSITEFTRIEYSLTSLQTRKFHGLLDKSCIYKQKRIHCDIKCTLQTSRFQNRCTLHNTFS